jgi:hypothetical protein
MMDNDSNNVAYNLSRAEQEDEAARNAVNPLAADIHRSLAIRYRARASGLVVYSQDDCQTLSIVLD